MFIITTTRTYYIGPQVSICPATFRFRHAGMLEFEPAKVAFEAPGSDLFEGLLDTVMLRGSFFSQILMHLGNALILPLFQFIIQFLDLFGQGFWLSFSQMWEISLFSDLQLCYLHILLLNRLTHLADNLFLMLMPLTIQLVFLSSFHFLLGYFFFEMCNLVMQKYIFTLFQVLINLTSLDRALAYSASEAGERTIMEKMSLQGILCELDLQILVLICLWRLWQFDIRLMSFTERARDWLVSGTGLQEVLLQVLETYVLIKSSWLIQSGWAGAFAIWTSFFFLLVPQQVVQEAPVVKLDEILQLTSQLCRLPCPNHVDEFLVRGRSAR